LGAKIEKEFPGASVKLEGGGRGDFIVTVDGRELWNKRQMDDEFPEEDAILAALRPPAKARRRRSPRGPRATKAKD
jgi:predicted Rdx family selenoprotein